MVAFTRTPYDEAVRRARRQDAILKVAALGVAGAVVGGALFIAKRIIDAKYPSALPKISVDYQLSWPKVLSKPVTGRI